MMTVTTPGFRTLLRIALPVAVACAANPAGARELGRLFYTPEQRASLERMRLAPPPKETPKPEPRVEAPRTAVSLDGIVTRSSGHSTTWINGIAQHDRAAPSPTSARVPVDERKGTVSLKVGETWDPSSGSRRSALGGGSIDVKRGN